MKHNWHINTSLTFLLLLLCSISTVWGTSSLNNQAAKLMDAPNIVPPSRQQEIPIPADGDCLYKAIMMAYLLPVAGDPENFNARLGKLVGQDIIIQVKETDKEDENNDDKKAAKDNLWDASELRQQFLNLDKRTLVYTLRHQPFSTLVTDFRHYMGMGNALWGGPQEIQIIANKLQITIEEYTPNPDDNNNTLAEPILIQPKQKNALLALRIVRDNPTNEEAVDNSKDWQTQVVQEQSVKDAQHRQHYRALLTSIPSFFFNKDNLPGLLLHKNNNYQLDESNLSPLQAHEKEKNNLLNKIELLRQKRGHFDGENAQETLKEVADALQQIGQFKHLDKEVLSPTDKALLTRERKIDELIKKYENENKDDIMDIIILNALKTCGDLETAVIFYENAMKNDALLIKNAESLKTKESKLHKLGLVFDYLGKYDQALSFYKQTLEILRKNKLGENHLNYAQTLHNIAGVYSHQGQYHNAIIHYKQALKIFKDTLGENHPSYATTLHNIALVYDDQGQYDNAIIHYKQALKIFKNTLDENHPSYAITLHNIAGVYDDQGQYDNAIIDYKQARKIFKNTLGENHPHYKAVVKNIEACKEQSSQTPSHNKLM